MPSYSRKFGDAGENIATRYLIKKRYKILNRNYRNSFGELDIIASKNGAISFFEVKTRDSRNSQHFLPEQSVNLRKQEKLRRLCAAYRVEHRFGSSQKWQIDILAITIDKFDETATINHIENAVFGSENR